MKTVASISGGRSSAYMAIHFPADINLFAVVLTEQSEAAPKDKGLLRECQKRIPGFIASREVDQTLKNLLWLEQEIGQEIKWVCAYESQRKASYSSEYGWLPKPLTFDQLIRAKKALPNIAQRWCTEELKYVAIYWHVFLNVLETPKDMCFMNIGYRADEAHRAVKMQDCKMHKFKRPSSLKVVTAKGTKINNPKNTLIDHEWRIPFFPMIENGVDHSQVLKYWQNNPQVKWPTESNCDMCFFKSREIVAGLFDRHPERIGWAIQKEEETGATFRDGLSIQAAIDSASASLSPLGTSKAFPVPALIDLAIAPQGEKLAQAEVIFGGTMSIRNRRRNRHRQAQALREADARAEQKIRNSFSLSMGSWGGSRCPSCGKQIRPHQLVDISGRFGNGFIDGCYANHPGPCTEDPTWEQRAWARAERAHRYRLRTGVDDGWQ